MLLIEQDVGPEQSARGVAGAVRRWVFGCPLWMLTAAVIAGAVAVHGYAHSTAMPETVQMVADPFHQDPTVGPWRYQSPAGELLAWAVGLRSAEGIAAVHLLLTCGLTLAAAYAVARWHSELAGRLFLLAFFCSPQSWAAVASLGLFDIITVAGLTVAVVAPTPAAVGVGVVLGFNHFEQAAVAAVAVAVIRRMRGGDWRRPTLGLAGGLVVGKLIVTVYLLVCGIDTNGRVGFIRDRGLADIVGGWTGEERVLLWAVFNVLWVGVLWMLADMDRWRRVVVLVTFLVMTLPVLVTYDLSRVYRTTTWPLVMLLVVYAAEHPNRELVRRWALLLVVAAVFVPRTEIWHGGLVLN